MLTLETIHGAFQFLSERIRQTPLESSAALSALLGIPVRLKLEFLQITGSFKVRGAMWRLQRCSDAERRIGVATCSAGNHGKGLAYAAAALGIRCTVFAPKSVDEAKARGIAALGADIRRSSFAGFDETEAWAKSECVRLGLPFISAFDDWDIMAGNGGSLALEVLQQNPDIRNWIVPVGGAGLAAGLCYSLKQIDAKHRIIGCQHRESPALALSLQRGEAVTELPPVQTLAGGVEGGIGRNTFAILKDRIDGVALVDEAEIRAAVRWMAENHQYWIEPTAAVTIAACLNGRVGPLEGPTAVLVCGRNASVETMATCLR